MTTPAHRAVRVKHGVDEYLAYLLPFISWGWGPERGGTNTLNAFYTCWYFNEKRGQHSNDREMSHRRSLG